MAQAVTAASKVSDRTYWPRVDADAHVIETEHTWDFLEPDESKYRPVRVAPTNNPRGTPQWMVEGELRGAGAARPPHEVQAGIGRTSWGVIIPPGTAELEDVDTRLRHMDEIGTDIQVMHTSIFGSSSMGKFSPDAEVAIYRSWNRWVADATKNSQGRLRWSAMVPVQTMDEGIKELDWAVQHGASAVFTPPVGVYGLMTAPEYYPMYEAAQRLNVPIAVHVGNADRSLGDKFRPGRIPGASPFTTVKMYVIACAHALIYSGIQSQFPSLRWVFLEAGAGWIPHVLHDLGARMAYGPESGSASEIRSLSSTVLADNRIYAAYETYEDLDYVLKYAGEDNLVTATDYGHTGQTAITDALLQITERGERGEVDPRVVDKMLRKNPTKLFGLENWSRN
jgi:predicted TIM-barrel fold metal-dependent hydrolase